MIFFSFPEKPCRSAFRGAGGSVWLRWCGCVLTLMVAGCATFPLDPKGFREAQARAPFAQQPLKSAWVSIPEAQMVLERTFGSVTEQRILLPNSTALPGDNMILLRAHGSSLATAGRFRPLDLLASTEAQFPPFADFDTLVFSTLEDGLGALNWAEWSNNAGLNCVLAFRRLDGASRIVPKRRAVIDVALRNCIYGSVKEALRPASYEQAGYAAGIARPSEAPQMLSPLAGPQP